MSSGKPLPPIIYKLMLVCATLIWGASFVAMKDATEVMEPSWLIGVRFLITGCILTLVFWKRIRASFTKKAFLAGALLGVLIFLAYWFQTVGLVYTTPGKNAFLTAIYCVIVPFLFWFIAKRKPTKYNLFAALLCILGVGLVSLAGDTLSLGFGDGMTIICGFMFAAHIVATSVCSKTTDIMVLTVIQFWVSGILGIITGLFTEPLPQLSAISMDFIFNMIYLVVFASCIALVFQNIAIAHMLPAQAAILLSLESVFGVLFSVFLYGEQLTLMLVLGFVSIFCAILLSEVFPLKKPPRAVDEALAEDVGAFE